MTAAAAATKADARRWFYHWMALTCLAISVIGFLPTFFLPVVQGTFGREPIVYVHGLLFFAWMIFFATQTWLAASGRVLAHREWGLLGIAIATAMFFSVVTVAIVRLNQPIGRPAWLVWGDISSMLYFETCIALALMNVRRPDTHKRLMLLATVSTLGAPIGRWVFLLLGPPPFLVDAQLASASAGPPTNPILYVLLNPNNFVILLVVVALVFDWRTRRRVSPAYVAGLLAFIANSYVMGGLIGATPAWAAAVGWLKGFGG